MFSCFSRSDLNNTRTVAKVMSYMPTGCLMVAPFIRHRKAHLEGVPQPHPSGTSDHHGTIDHSLNVGI